MTFGTESGPFHWLFWRVLKAMVIEPVEKCRHGGRAYRRSLEAVGARRKHGLGRVAGRRAGRRYAGGTRLPEPAKPADRIADRSAATIGAFRVCAPAFPPLFRH